MVVLGQGGAGEPGPDRLMDLGRAPDQLPGGCGVPPACQVDEIEVFEGLRRRDTVERADIVIAHADGPGRAVADGVIDLGRDVPRRAFPCPAGRPTIEIGQDEAGAGIFRSDLGDAADFAGDGGDGAFRRWAALGHAGIRRPYFIRRWGRME